MKLSVKSALITSAVVVAAAATILVVVTYLTREELRSAVWHQLDSRLAQEIVRLQAGLDGVAADASAIAAGPDIRSFIEASRSNRNVNAAQATLDSVLAAVAASHPTYFQIRYVDATGIERARVDRRNGKVLIVPTSQLQNKSQRDYVRGMLALKLGQVYISPLDLNQEHGVVERPLVPTLRIAVPVFDEAGARSGGVIINLDANQVLPPRQIGAISFIVVNSDGYYLRHPDPNKEFGFDLGKNDTIQTENEEAAAALHTPVGGLEVLRHGLTTSDPELVSIRRFQYDPSDPRHVWQVIAAEPAEVAHAPIDNINRRVAFLIVTIAAIASAAGWFAAFGTVKPIHEMAVVARRITMGDVDAAVNVRGSNEVAILGAAFNAMTDRLKNLIKDEQKAREELAEANQELRRSNEELEQFAFASSHDLRSPLRSIAMLRTWIDEDIAQTESASNDVRDHLALMDQQIGRMSRLLDDLLEYARIGKAEAKIRLFDPEEVTRNALALLQLPPAFKVDLAFENRQIMAVPVEFELVVRNLLDNAVKHHDMPTGSIRVSVEYDDDTLILEVADDGPGIPPSYHKKVLEPFATLKRRDECEGSGLGLALVNKIVQRWNGHLEILSQGGMRGTTFRITMPIRQLKVVAGTESPPARPSRAAFDSVAS